MRGVFGHAQRAEAREIEVHLRRGLGARGHLELDLHPVDGVGFPGLGDVDRRHDERNLTGRQCLPEAAADVPPETARQHGAVHVARTAHHRRAGVDVFLHGVRGEPLRRQHRHLSRVHVGLGGDAEHPTEMIDMAVGVDDRDHGAVGSAVGAIQVQRGGGHLGGHQRVDDDQPSVTLNEADIGDIESADLIDARHHLVEALFRGQLGLPPQAGMHRCRRGTVEKRVRVVVPHHATIGSLDHTRGQRGNESAIGVVEIRCVMQR